MATKKRFKEAEFVDQNETQAQAVPATDAEVAQAAPVEAAPAEPVDAAPVEDKAVLPEGTDEAAADGGVEVNPATVSVQVQIPVDQLGAAVAQATGDQEVANLSPDVESAQEAELVSETPDEDIPVEGATEEAPAEMGGDEGVEPQLESKESADNRLKEDVFTDSDKVEGKDDYGKGDSSDDNYQDGKDSANKHEDPRMDMIDHAIPEEGKALKESEDDDEVEDEADDLPPGMEGEDADLDMDALGGEEGPGFAASNEFDVEIDENDPAVQDFLSKIDDYLADEEAQPAQVADALRASADFFDAIAPEEEEAEDGDLLDVEEGEDDIEDDGDIPLDLDAINGYKTSGHAKTGDDVLDQFSELPEEDEDYEESVTRVPCKFPGKKFSESKRVPRDLPLVKETKRVKESFEDDEYFDEDEDWDAYEEFDKLIDEWGAEKALRALKRFISNYDPDLITNFVDEVKKGNVDAGLYESKKPVAKKLNEETDYSAVKFPAGSSDADDDNDIISVYEKTQNSRRNAIRNFRESVIRNEENIPSRQSASRFNEALRSSVRMNGSSKGSKSWADNKFLDKYNESQELNFKQLISEGFLG
jgi:hypothetical protein